MNPSNLESRLQRLDLQLDSGGIHLDDERIAELCAGAEPGAAEAGHLAGCDLCVELLVALGEGLEALAMDEPALGALMAEAPRPPRRRGRRWTPLMLVALAGAAAAAGWFAHRQSTPKPAPAPGIEAPARPVAEPARPATKPAPGAAVDAPDEVPIVPADSLMERRGAALPDDGEPGDGEPAAPASPPAAAAQTAPDEIAPDEIAPDEAPAKSPRPRSRPTARPAPPGLGTLERPAGPRPLDRMPVDGPPRGFGWLQLNTRPSARVFIDGKPHGWTPVIDLRLPEGPHDVRLVFESPLAAEPEQRFRVLVETDRTWRMTRDNVRRPAQ